MRVEFAASATVGNRVPKVELRDVADDIIWGNHMPFNIAASATNHIELSINSPVNDASADARNKAYRYLLEALVPQGYDFRIYDTAAVDAAADDMVIQFLWEEWIEE